MKTEEVRKKLIDYSDGNLNPEDKEFIIQELEQNPTLHEEYKQIVDISERLKAISKMEIPHEKLRCRFQAMIEEEKKKERAKETSRPNKSFTLRYCLFRFAYTAAVLAMGVLLGMKWNFQSQTVSDNSLEITELRTQIADMNRLVTHSLLQQKSASERIEAVLATLAQGQVDNQLLMNLVGILTLDPSINVRLSALEALAPHTNEEVVRAGLHTALPKEDAPLVQIAMIELLVKTQDKQSAPILEKLCQNDKTNPNVRETAQWALGILNMIGEESNNRSETFVL